MVTVVFGGLGLKWRKEKRRLRREEDERRLGVESGGRGGEEGVGEREREREMEREGEEEGSDRDMRVLGGSDERSL